MNVKELKEFLDADDEFIATLIEGFMDELPNALETIRNSVDQEDWDTVKQTAHKLLGSTKVFQLDRLSTLLETLEGNAWKRTNLDRMPELAFQLEESGKEVINELHQALYELKQHDQ